MVHTTLLVSRKACQERSKTKRQRALAKYEYMYNKRRSEIHERLKVRNRTDVYTTEHLIIFAAKRGWIKSEVHV
jgi:hypothetical protein